MLVAGLVPVKQRMIKQRHDAVLVTRVHKLADKVAPCRGVRRVVIVETAGVVEVVGENSFFWDATAAIKHADKLLLKQEQ